MFCPREKMGESEKKRMRGKEEEKKTSLSPFLLFSF